MATETKIQSIIHKLEEGGWAKWIKLSALVVAVIVVGWLWLFGNSGFRGLAHPRAFEQAEIARELSRGHGFSTKFIRPAALYQFREWKGGFPIERIPETYHAPVWPTVIAPFFWLIKNKFELEKNEVVFEPDRMMAIVATVFFLLSVILNYFLAKRLFDQRLAVIGSCLLLVCDHFWQFSMSGLPQMLMLFLFTGAMYCLLRAVESWETERLGVAEEPEAGEDQAEAIVHAAAPEVGQAVNYAPVPPPLPGVPSPGSLAGVRVRRLWRGAFPWLVACALCFAVLALTHALTIWIFMGVLLFCAIYFRPIGLYAAIMFAIVGLSYTPWLVRNYQACGSPFGVGIYVGMTDLRGNETGIMRSNEPPYTGLSPSNFRRKIFNQADNQLTNLYGYLGGVVAAPFFFVALLHQFRRRSTALLRWAILLCWLAALFGMSVFGVDYEPLKASDLHLLFIPLMTFYGLAFILVLWSRLEIRVQLARVAFMIMLFLVSGHTFVIQLLDLLGPGSMRVQWPPYIPPYVAVLGNWTKENEIIMSDMPWAVAWYADRRSLWVPATIPDYLKLDDWGVLKGRIVGLYLTPISGNAEFLTQLKKGEWAEWSPFIERTANLKNFPLKTVTPLDREKMLVFYADRDRWTVRED